MTPFRIRAVALTACLGLMVIAPPAAWPAQRVQAALGAQRGLPAYFGPGLSHPAAVAPWLRPVMEVPAFGTYAWPVVGPVIRGFEEPSGPYAPGHRGIDIAVPFGTAMVAAQDGVVAFAGSVGGSLFISIDHPDGVRTTYSWVSSIAVSKGQRVNRGEVIGLTGHGHPDEDRPHLHFGARVGTTYIDPMLLLERGDVSGFIHLAPLEPGSMYRS
jgi:murein DD-endopeptidase MepM/ murein hydrolase activator NlpD